MKAFVAGATGLTGRHVVEHLVAAGVEAVAHVRPDSSQVDAWRTRFSAVGAEVDTSPWTREGMGAAMAKHRPDRVFALLGTTRAREKSGGGDYEAVDYGLSVLLIDALAAKGPKDARVIYLSSLGAEGGRGAYLQARQRVEAHLRESGVVWTIARPSVISGDRDESRPGESAARVAVDGAMAVVGVFSRRTADRYRSITGDELGAGLVRAALDEAAAGRVLDSADLRR